MGTRRFSGDRELWSTMSALARRLRKKKARKNPAPRHNPPLIMDVLEMAAPAGAGFVATRGLTKLGMAIVEKKWPSKSKHVGAAVSVAAFLAMWFLGHRVKWLQKYHVPITAGAGIATGVNLVQIYIPKLGWFFGDPTKMTAGSPAALTAGAQNALPAHLEVVDEDPQLYTWNDKYDGGRVAQNQAADPKASDQPDPIADLMNNDDDLGVFAGGLAS